MEDDRGWWVVKSKRAHVSLVYTMINDVVPNFQLFLIMLVLFFG